MVDQQLRCCEPNPPEPVSHEGVPTKTSLEEERIQEKIIKCFKYIRSRHLIDKNIPSLERGDHLKWLINGLFTPASWYQSLDCAQPWLVYWITHSIALLGDEVTLSSACERIINFLAGCRLDGGYGGGPDHLPHLATTYAAVNALVTMGKEEALKSIDRKSLYNYLMHMRQPDGSFVLHEDGESDVRGIYCAAAVAYITGIHTPELFEKSDDWLLQCQTYEGGFGATPDEEAHGGYSFCALAALTLFGQAHRCDLKALLRWTVMKQKTFEGGFSGRTNKLVDGCYSFWQSAVIAIIESYLTKEAPQLLNAQKWMFNQQALQEYLLCCCQDSRGGLIDKPGKPADFYHTCYDLSGLSIAQFAFTEDLIVGPESNRLVPVHPVYNLTMDSVRFASQYFKENPSTQLDLS